MSTHPERTVRLTGVSGVRWQPRERDVLSLVGQGLSNAATAHRLDLTEKTVKNHVNHIFAKLRVSNRTEAVVVWSGGR